MLSTLPRWIEYSAFVLALVAGYVNAIGFVGLTQHSISHLSGTATLIGTSLIDSSTSVLYLLAVLGSFLVGAAISGIFLSGHSLKIGRHYDSLLIIEASLLLVSIYFLNKNLPLGHFIASAACGLQNALATTYSGAIVRTTHVTGIFTDLGLMIGARIKGQAFDRRKAVLFLLIVSGFILGGILGAFLFQSMHFFALVIPATICVILAILYHTLIRH